MVIVTTIGTATGSYIRQPGSTKLQQIPPLVPGCAMIANEINNFGAVAGIAYLDGIADRNFHAFVYANGKSTDLGTLPPTVPNPGLLSSQAFGINIWGQIVGDSEDRIANFTHGIIYYNGVMHDLNSMLSASTKGWVIVEANSINDLGQILCYASYQNNPSVSVILTPNLILP
jgi:probable HAF family extracellular repeat protein